MPENEWSYYGLSWFIGGLCFLVLAMWTAGHVPALVSVFLWWGGLPFSLWRAVRAFDRAYKLEERGEHGW